ncbi:signal peptide protein [Bacillus cytotoxicus]|uniref:Signal peptide protein n=1 Tax=Bacillus cytotoxicus TaxID=580165 RepID=A0ACC6AB08_9BACI|nr:signal peptide protein [Bacillus cytotoxicus]HDX9578582.1 signal peptide protein [Bacillus pseudomycoides]
MLDIAMIAILVVLVGLMIGIARWSDHVMKEGKKR